jgi:hypothetical protein
VQLFEAFEHTRLLLTLERVLEWDSLRRQLTRLARCSSSLAPI